MKRFTSANELILISVAADWNYGAEIVRLVNKASQREIIKPNSTYTLLSRLEQAELLESKTQHGHDQDRVYYRCTDKGRELLRSLKKAREDLISMLLEFKAS